jgi:hypothetical protein
MRMELAQLVANRVEEASRPLREEVANLKLLLARVGVSFETTEACSSGGQELATVEALFPLGSTEPKSSVVEVTPELHELCGDSSVVPGLLELSGGVAMPPSIEEAFGFDKSGVVDVDAPISRESNMHVIPIGDEVAESGVQGAVVAREVCDFLATLVAAYPGSAVN